MSYMTMTITHLFSISSSSSGRWSICIPPPGGRPGWSPWPAARSPHWGSGPWTGSWWTGTCSSRSPACTARTRPSGRSQCPPRLSAGSLEIKGNFHERRGQHFQLSTVTSFELRQPEPLLSVSHYLTLGGDGVEMAVTVRTELDFKMLPIENGTLTWVGIWR